MSTNAAYLEVHLSGGAGNASPNASLGGAISTTLVGSQSATGISNVTGVSIIFAAGNQEGNGTLKFYHTGQQLSWTPNGGSEGPVVSAGVDGKYALFGNGDNGFVAVQVTAASLPGTDQTDTINVNYTANNLYDNVSQTDSFNGDTEYRCYYIKNAHPTDPMAAVVMFISGMPNPGSVAFGVDPAGVGNGSSSGVATTVANENTAPAGVTFGAPVTEAAGTNVGTLNAGQCVAIWTKRIIPALNAVQNPEAVAQLSAQVFF
jgi:hypothetical protein